MSSFSRLSSISIRVLPGLALCLSTSLGFAAGSAPSDRREVFYLQSQSRAESLGRLQSILPELTAPIGAPDMPWDPDRGEMQEHSRESIPYFERALEDAYGSTYTEGVRILTERAERLLDTRENLPVGVQVLLQEARGVAAQMERDKDGWSVLHTVFRGVVEFQDGVFAKSSESWKHCLRIARLGAYQKELPEAFETLQALLRGFLPREKELFPDVSVGHTLATLVQSQRSQGSLAVRFRGLEAGLRRLEKGGQGKKLYFETCQSILQAQEHLEAKEHAALWDNAETFLTYAKSEERDLLESFGSKRRREELPKILPGWFPQEVLRVVGYTSWNHPRIVTTSVRILLGEPKTLGDFFTLVLELLESQPGTFEKTAFAYSLSRRWPDFKIERSIRARLEALEVPLKRHFLSSRQDPNEMKKDLAHFQKTLEEILAELTSPPRG